MTSGIGGAGGGGPPKIGGPTGPAAPNAASKAGGPKGASFGETLGTKGAEQAGASPLERLRSGELDLKGYVDVRVREATAHLEKVLSPGDLAKVQDELRDVIENDPDIAALVKGAER